jgi:uncharacterized membrane protein YkvA (DUF1232 family)
MRDNSFVTVILILVLLCILSHIDLIPDVIPVAGWVDDLAFGVGAGAAALGQVDNRKYQGTCQRQFPMCLESGYSGMISI